jgi:hypothetical protein
MFAHKSVPHLSSQCALAHMAKTLSFYKKLILRKKLNVDTFSSLDE